MPLLIWWSALRPVSSFCFRPSVEATALNGGFWASSCLISRAEAIGSYGLTKPDRHIPYSSSSGAPSGHSRRLNRSWSAPFEQKPDTAENGDKGPWIGSRGSPKRPIAINGE